MASLPTADVQIIIMNSDSEGDDAAPYMDASLVAGWQQHPNAGASALQVGRVVGRECVHAQTHES